MEQLVFGESKPLRNLVAGLKDMDIAVRAHLHGWKFIYLNDVKLSQLEEQKQVVAKKPVKKTNKVSHKELALAVRSLLAAQGVHFYFLLFQGVSPFFSWVLTS
ncbi:hypothetical protein F2Q69_00009768 [Brassica cretica]|uniref:Uncharacterized protein n=1 Tax=Brassica cretica TaxID=69181 RepID=A0A8S9P1K2_BRACR|nr:hypothetical protein F2Q69_00009768 [Brassica cretica]